MKKFYLHFLLLLFAVPLFAQNPYAIRGIVQDSVSNIKLVNTTISVLNAKDSTLVRFGRAAADGSFTIHNLRKGAFIVLVTYPDYADYIENFSLDSLKTAYDFGKLNLSPKSRLLAEVMIKGEVAAIKIKGDTTEFNAKAFTIQPNSKVEDLLKQLPGIQVDKDGKITAQGQTVNKVLVDGEEFFGDDPTLVTKNIRGDMVDKVQLYDKKSDQATFTGIDDGIRNKTINIKTKDDKKNGYFGKADGGGSADFYQGQGMFNAFKAKKKFSAYGTIGNTGKTGLGWEDASKYGASGSNVEYIDGGIMIMNGGSGDNLDSFDGRYNGEGIPLAKTGGLHYDTKWDGDKSILNANYKIGSLAVDGTKGAIRQNNTFAGAVNNSDTQNFNNYMFRQKLDVMYSIKLDTSATLKLTIDGTLKNTETRTRYSAASLLNNEIRRSGSERTIQNDGDQQMLNASALYTRKLKKPGRTISASFSQAFNHNNTDGYLNADNQYYTVAGADSVAEDVDQYKTTVAKSSVFNSTFTYTEPITSTISVVMNYGLNLNNSSSDRKSFNQTAPGVYNDQDEVYSNSFKLDQLANQGGATFNYKKKKTTITMGTRATAVSFKQKNLYTNNEYERNFLNWYPQASYQYRMSQQKSLRLSYNGNTTQPNIDQVQPIRNNIDPLYEILGNPNLKPSFNNRVSVNYNSYKVLTGQAIYLDASYSVTMNPIATDITYSGGKTTSQARNIDNKNTSGLYMNLYLDRKLKKLDMNVGFNLSASTIQNYNYSNNLLNGRQSQNYSGGFSFSKYKEKKYDARISVNPNYTFSSSSLPNQLSNDGGGYYSDAYFNIYLPGKVQLSSDMTYQFRAKTQSFDENLETFLVNTTISKKFLKAENVKLSLSGNDLLNQNRGFSRNATNTTISQTSYTTIKRYFLFSLTWDFSKMGGGVKTPQTK